MEKYLDPTGWAYYIDDPDKLTFYGALDTYYEECAVHWKAEETRRQYGRDYIDRILPALEGHNDRPLRDYTCEDFEKAIERIQAQGRGRTGGKYQAYAESTIQHFRFLMNMVVTVAARHGVCDNVLWGSKFCLTEDNCVPSGPSRTRLKRSLTNAQEIAVWNTLSDAGQRGEYMGLLLMFALGLRNNEACGANFGDIRPMRGHENDFVLIIYKTTALGSNQLKTGGKTRNADRMLPVPIKLLEVLAARRARIQAEMPQADVDKLPIACVGSDYTRRCNANQITAAGRQLFCSIGMDSRQLAYIDMDLADPRLQVQLREKDQSAYLFRRNFGTHLHVLGLSEAEIQYVLGHDIEDAYLSRGDFMDEDKLYAIKQKLDRRPLLNELPQEGSVMPVCQNSGEQYQLSDLQEAAYAIPMRRGVLRLRLKAKEPYETLRVRVIVNGANEDNRLGKECFFSREEIQLERSTDVNRQYHIAARRAQRRAEEQSEN